MRRPMIMLLLIRAFRRNDLRNDLMYADLLLVLKERDLDTKETKACLTCCIARLPQCLLSPCLLSVMFFGVVLVRQLKDYRAICRSFTNKLMILPKLLTKRVIAN